MIQVNYWGNIKPDGTADIVSSELDDMPELGERILLKYGNFLGAFQVYGISPSVCIGHQDMPMYDIFLKPVEKDKLLRLPKDDNTPPWDYKFKKDLNI